MNTAAENPLFPRTIVKQVSDLHTKKAYLNKPDVSPRLGVTDVQIIEMDSAVVAVDAAHAKAENKDTRTKLDVFNRVEEIKKAHSTFRRIINICVVNNPAAIPEDYVALNVPRPKHNSSLPVPGKYPSITTGRNTIRRLEIGFHDQDKETRGKPHGVSGAIIRWAILDSPPVNVDDLTNTVLDTASPCILEFTEEQRGKRVYFCLAWQNPKGEKGPWSEIVNAIIP